MSPANDRRKGNRGLTAALVVVMFIGIGANALVMGLLAEQEEKAAASRARIEEVAADVLRLVKQAQPCMAGEPKSLACQRKAANDKVVADAIVKIEERVAAKVEDHDINAKNQHDTIRARLGVTAPLPPRTPITAAPRLSTAPTAPRPATAAPAPSPAPVTTQPATTTTSGCERLPNGKCRR